MDALTCGSVMLVADDHQAALALGEAEEVLIGVQPCLREVLRDLLPVDLVESGELRYGVVGLELRRPAAAMPGRQPGLDLGEGRAADPAADAEDVHEVVLGVREDRVMRVGGPRAVRRVGDYLAEGAPLEVGGLLSGSGYTISPS